MANKYRAKKTECNSLHTHDSKAEAQRCATLTKMEADGLISDLCQQYKIEVHINGKPVKTGNGRKMKLTVDFAYLEDGNTVYEDVKGMITKDFAVKWSILKHLHPESIWRIWK